MTKLSEPQAPLCPIPWGQSYMPELKAPLYIVEFMVKFICQHNVPVGSYHTFKMLDFWCSKGKKWDPPVTPKLKVREVSQSGFWNISSHPTSVPSFSQIGWPQLLAPGTLSQTMTLKARKTISERFRQFYFFTKRSNLQLEKSRKINFMHSFFVEKNAKLLPFLLMLVD